VQRHERADERKHVLEPGRNHGSVLGGGKGGLGKSAPSTEQGIVLSEDNLVTGQLRTMEPSLHIRSDDAHAARVPRRMRFRGNRAHGNSWLKDVPAPRPRAKILSQRRDIGQLAKARLFPRSERRYCTVAQKGESEHTMCADKVACGTHWNLIERCV
jgi:hypothetical protein